MNSASFKSSGPLSWAMYFMRKGRSGNALFGKVQTLAHKCFDIIYFRLSFSISLDCMLFFFDVFSVLAFFCFFSLALKCKRGNAQIGNYNFSVCVCVVVCFHQALKQNFISQNNDFESEDICYDIYIILRCSLCFLDR